MHRTDLRPDGRAPDAASPRTRRLVLACGLALLVLSLLPPAATIGDAELGDLWLYRWAATKLWSGSVPYQDWSIEYPPYALGAFLLPGVFHAGAYVVAFAAQMLLLDVLVKVLLLVEGRRWQPGWLGLAPLALFALDGWAQSFLYLKRFDLVPAALVLLAAFAFSRGRTLRAGAALACAAGVKLYPLVLVPVLAAAALRQRRLGRFAAGLGIGLAPLAVLSFFLPWWHSVSFQAGRNLQAESIYASVIWLLHLTAGVPARWTWVHAWMDVEGPVAAALVQPARILFGVAVLVSVAGAARSAWRAPPTDARRLAVLLLCPLLALIAFANVLSPQFIIWYWALLALALPAASPFAVASLAGAGLLTAVVYPSPGYDTPAGLELSRTIALVCRNLLLVGGWAILCFGDVMRARAPAAPAVPLPAPTPTGTRTPRRSRSARP